MTDTSSCFVRIAGRTAFVAVFSVALTACGGSGPNAEDEERARQAALGRCVAMSGQQQVCECSLESIKNEMSTAQYKLWVDLQLAAEDAGQDIDRAAENAGLSREEFIDASTDFAKIAMTVSIECAEGMQ